MKQRKLVQLHTAFKTAACFVIHRKFPFLNSLSTRPSVTGARSTARGSDFRARLRGVSAEQREHLNGNDKSCKERPSSIS
ncbi:hypothetical protein RB213_002593 [Colletotrichum asianum]